MAVPNLQMDLGTEGLNGRDGDTARAAGVKFNTHLHQTVSVQDAIDGAAAPTAENVFATMADVPVGGAPATPSPSPTATPTAEWHPNDSVFEASGSASFATESALIASTHTSRHGSLSVALFDGTNDAYTLATDLAYPLSYTFTMVMNPWTLAANDRFVQGAAPAAGGSIHKMWGVLSIGTTGALNYYFGDNTNYSSGSTEISIVAAKAWHVVTLKYTAGDDACEIWVNGVAATITPGVVNSTAAGGDGTSSFKIGRAGAVAGGTFPYFHGLMGDWYFWNSALGDADRGIVETALMTAYGIS